MNPVEPLAERMHSVWRRLDAMRRALRRCHDRARESWLDDAEDHRGALGDLVEVLDLNVRADLDLAHADAQRAIRQYQLAAGGYPDAWTMPEPATAPAITISLTDARTLSQLAEQAGHTQLAVRLRNYARERLRHVCDKPPEVQNDDD